MPFNSALIGIGMPQWCSTDYGRTQFILLTPREREIVALIARDLTNAQIALSLGISARTADTHVSHILAKLSLARRADVAAWSHRQGWAVTDDAT